MFTRQQPSLVISILSVVIQAFTLHRTTPRRGHRRWERDPRVFSAVAFFYILVFNVLTTFALIPKAPSLAAARGETGTTPHRALWNTGVSPEYSRLRPPIRMCQRRGHCKQHVWARAGPPCDRRVPRPVHSGFGGMTGFMVWLWWVHGGEGALCASVAL